MNKLINFKKQQENAFKFLIKYRTQILVFFIIGVFIDIFFIDEYFDPINLFLLSFWLVSIRNFKFKSNLSGKVTIFFLVLAAVTYQINKNMAEKTAVWAFFFLSVTVGQQILEVKKEDV